MGVLEKINIAKVSQFLASNDIAKAGLFGGGQDLQLPRKIYCIRKNVEWLYNLDNTDSTLEGTSNYLISLCAPYNLTGQYIINNGGSGSVSPVNPNTRPVPLDFEVSGSSFIATGESSKVIPQFAGYNILFVRGGIGQYQTNLGDGSTYFSWDRNSALFTCYGAAQAGELFLIYPFI